ncbi:MULTISPECIES: hypothetical protein [Cysteiniphilum]|uniref:Uncharacterized protein n=1 Tax=Cysteiniphilum litorale TaxID=2056700 RepID=A0A8J2Z4G8_9GAMM|nr:MULTISPECIES: hypothetical protein [Cysteiniphilum]GGF96763.1 hypothetical protein GCM10010995_12520 [Cysteiniphilum litorale]
MKKSIKLSLYSSMMAIILTGQINAVENPTASITATVSASVPVTFTSNVAFVLYDGLGKNPQVNPTSITLSLGANASVNISTDAQDVFKGVWTGLSKPVSDTDSMSIDYFDVEAVRWLAVYEEQNTKSISALDINFFGADSNKMEVNGKDLYATVVYPLDGSAVSIEDKSAVTLGTDNVTATAISKAKELLAWNPATESDLLMITDTIASDQVAYIPFAFVVGSKDIHSVIEYINTFGSANAYNFNGINVQIKATFS